MGIPLKAGRDFTERDTKGALNVIIINETLAKNLLPGEDPIGKIVRADNPERTVVGVVGDVHHMALEEGAGNEFYIPMRQTQDYGTVDLVVRTSMPTTELASRLREALRPIEPDLPTANMRTLQTMVDRAVSPRRFVVLAAWRIRGICAGAGFAGDLCGDFLLGEPANAGDWDSYGAGRIGRGAAEKYFVADAGTGGDWHGCRRRGFVGAGANVERTFVWSDVERSGDVCWDASDSHRCCGTGGIFAGAKGFADRSNGGLAN